MVNLPIIDICVPRARGRFSCWFGRTILNVLGWQIKGGLPARKKFVLAVAPHTSNWDFVIGISVMLALNLRIKFMGKKNIFIWPFRNILTRLGGIPIDRKYKQGVVAQMVEQFNSQEQLILALAPEGTRSKTVEWKSGFLRIAHQASVPVIPVSLDYSKKEVCFHNEVNIEEDIDSELKRFKQLFDGVCAKNQQAV